jgi:stringent starvation protein B
MTPSRPYLLRAIYDWLIDNEQTPYLLVNADAEGVIVPREHVQDGKIILNISMTATRDLELGNEGVTFSARFSGKPMQVNVPILSALALYSKENGRGMMFPDEGTDDDPDTPEPDKNEGSQKPHLTLVK